MIAYESIIQLANDYLQIYSLKDILEVSFFIFCIYKISTWLNKDHTKPLLLYFYGYFATLFSAYFFNLSTMYQVTLASAPIFFTLLIVHHQKNFQKNFILSQQKPINPGQIPHKQWLEILVRSCLVASHHKKNITCIIERNDDISPLLEKPFTIDIAIQKQIIDMLLESAAYNDHKLIWVTQHGHLMSINASWSDLVINELIFNQISPQQLPQEYAKVVTTKTDAMILHINTEQTFNFVAHQGKIVENLTIDQELKLIKKILHTKPADDITVKGTSHVENKNTSISSADKN